VVISFDTAGALLLSRSDPSASATAACKLFFDPRVIEGTWQEDLPGQMIGYTSCLTTGIARQLLLAPGTPDIDAGIEAGLSAERRLHLGGYLMAPADGRRLSFPLARIAQELSAPSETFAAVAVQDPVRFLEQPADQAQDPSPDGWWTILEDLYQDNLDQLAERVVQQGAESALSDVPQGRFGHMLTVDRREIESFRCIATLAAEYLSHERQKRPLSIAVFGAPGSGKSFGITQVAQTLAPGRIQVLEFNLSQFGDPEEIADALHRVRDATLSGSIPLVFWDEFDSSLDGQPLAWLKYFLAPMQDGAFRQGQIVHPIGRAIFVFAGGTSHRLADFGRALDADTYRAAKVPDFVSRLKGYVDILGPNPPADHEVADPYYIVRRAILLRSILERNASQLFEKRAGQKILRIDHGVLRAFLGIGRYKHGIRSMESIVAMSQLAGKAAYERSSLPSESQLGLHVDGQEFLSLVQQLDLEGALLDALAKAHHQQYCKSLRADNYTWGPTNDEAAKTSTALCTWNKLPEDEKSQNRAAVRDIPHKLAQVGYAMIPARSDQPPFKFPEDDGDLERLAEMEHARWMAQKLAAGWRYGSETDKAARIHEALLPWKKLQESQKEKDRDLVRAVPEILAAVGYTVVKLRDEDAAR
jgi:hypothetical protein